MILFIYILVVNVNAHIYTFLWRERVKKSENRKRSTLLSCLLLTSFFYSVLLGLICFAFFGNIYTDSVCHSIGYKLRDRIRIFLEKKEGKHVFGWAYISIRILALCTLSFLLLMRLNSIPWFFFIIIIREPPLHILLFLLKSAKWRAFL